MASTTTHEDPDIIRELHSSVLDGDVSQVRKLLKSGVDPNALDCSISPLMRAGIQTLILLQ